MSEEIKKFEELNAAFELNAKKLDEFIANAKKELGDADGKAAEAVKSAEALAKQHETLVTRMTEAEQKLAEGLKKGTERPATVGETFIKSEAYQAFRDGKQAKVRLELKNTITGQEGSPPENSDVLVPPSRLPGIIPGAFRSLRIRDVIPSGATASNAVEYTRELAFVNRAAETAEGETKPESDVTFELVSAPVRTIAHWLKLSKQVLDDAPALASYIDVRLRYGVDLRIDTQLLRGNGSGQNISGMMNSGNFTAFTPATGDTALDSINRAIYQVWAADYAPTAMVMGPADWGAIERIKGDDEHYVIGNPQSALGPTLWGLPVVISNAMTPGKFILGAMDIAYQVWNRQGTAVEMYEQDEDNVQTNLVTVRAENRLALAIYRPASVVSGNLVQS
jgi:HK97 family phage major capsid protein